MNEVPLFHVYTHLTSMHDCTHGGNAKTDKPKTTADNNEPLIQVFDMP